MTTSIAGPLIAARKTSVLEGAGAGKLDDIFSEVGSRARREFGAATPEKA
jgi:hypothetical protein